MEQFTKEELQAFEEILAYNCAPTFAKVKPASIITVLYRVLPAAAEEIVDYYNSFMSKKGLRMTILDKRRDSMLLMVYCPKLLDRALAKPEVADYLFAAGYPIGYGLGTKIAYLSYRLHEQSGFPHEIGLFLGYPLADVEGFIKNKGQNFKITGYWKVYGDEAITNQLFSAYNFCRQIFVDKFNTGFTVKQILAATV